jgi:hypothetical protein
LAFVPLLRAVVDRVRQAITVDVPLADQRLAWVVDTYTVVALVHHSIAIEVVITGIPKPVLIAILGLAPLCVDHLRAVIDRVGDPISVTISARVRQATA